MTHSPDLPRQTPTPGDEPKPGAFARLLRRLIGTPKPRVALVRLAGVIADGGGGLPGRGRSLNLHAIDPLLEKAFKTRRAKAVALVINSPGGSPAQSSLIAARIRQLADEHKVPVIAFVEDMAASGGYWLACAADEIIADPCAIVGSIGVITQSFGAHEAIARLGIERRVYTAGAEKGLLDPFLPENPDDVARLRHIQGQLHRLFREWVESRRVAALEGKEGDREALFTGAFWLAPEAQALGLIDSLGSAAVTLRERFGKQVQIQSIEPKRPLFSLPGMGAEAAQRLLESALEQLEERAIRARYGR